ncbi:MAG TPA: divalent-cation tolerance protein CutA [Thermoplasmatales archaeon]|nr:divalent-cation tolerance protein CutA [Thermoplasmatales archaeon]
MFFIIMYCIIITTCNEEDERKIIDSLLSSKVVACINSFDVKSTYIWKRKIEKEKEKMLVIKTKIEKYAEVEKKIKENHSYEVPEIICIEIKNGYDGYLKWIDSVIK